MDYQLDKKITINKDTKHKSLYQWCLNEVNANGSLDNRDLIPFRWSLYFTGTSLQVSTSVNVVRDSKTDEIKSVKSTNIYGKFYSGICRDGENLSDDVEFSIFGTDRKVNEFSVTISETQDASNEACWLTAIPSYETENVNFCKVIENDFIGFDINLETEKFNELVRLIETRAIDSVRLIARNVNGIYSEWTPTITTHSVKVLTTDNVIDGVDINQFEGSTAGLIGDFNIQFTTQIPLSIKQHLPDVDFANEFNDEKYEDVTHSNDNRAASNESMGSLTEVVGKLKTALWCVVIALVFLLLK
jgi:hypothetical protein